VTARHALPAEQQSRLARGSGALAKALALRATDNGQQEEPTVRAHYQALGQSTVRYGENVERLEALAAVDNCRPQVVVGCWVAHRLDPVRPEAGGSASGVDEAS